MLFPDFMNALLAPSRTWLFAKARTDSRYAPGMVIGAQKQMEKAQSTIDAAVLQRARQIHLDAGGGVGGDLFFVGDHCQYICAGENCGADLRVVGLPKLVYEFIVCSCELSSYPHMIEKLWHRDCLMPPKPE
jgi:hypothetical protein